MIDVKKILFRTRVTVPEAERAVALVNGKLNSILRPGRHSFAALGTDLKLEAHDLKQPVFTSAYEQVLLKEMLQLVAGHFTEVRTGEGEVAVVEQQQVGGRHAGHHGLGAADRHRDPLAQPQ